MSNPLFREDWRGDCLRYKGTEMNELPRIVGPEYLAPILHKSLRPRLVQGHGCVFPLFSFRRHSSTSFDHCSE